MGKVSGRLARRLRNLSLKWSFALYALSCILVALVCSFALASLFSGLRDELYAGVLMRVEDDMRLSGSVLDESGETLNQFIYYTMDVWDLASAREQRLYRCYNVLIVMTFPVVFILCLLFTGMLFYRRKLRRPLAQIEDAAARIARSDLDFVISTPKKGNEMDRALGAVEKMRRALAQSISEMWRMLEERKRMQAAFSHDLRTPLAVLRGYSDFLRAYYPDRLTREKVESTLEVMDSHIARLERYTATMGEAARLDEVAPEPRRVRLDDLGAQMAAEGALLCPNGRFCFAGEAAGEAFVDAALVLRVFENLVSNAARYARARVEAAFWREEDFVVLRVRDDGRGFSAEGLKRAMEPYFRDGADARDGEHFGLGLYICRALAERHGGILRVENAPEGGARVEARFQALPPT